ncbi:hypothetical protein ASZ90_019472 [hydrocarbon metagenome]|uniref:Uncharacterized protein n=1 Tax=hydrocarbon metagenome TaxID=938273 RepID=A0A0W8E3C0_9ZZZZ
MYSDHGFNEEIIDQYLGTLYNLKTLLHIKKELGDYVDITDRYFGYNPCCDSGFVYFCSVIAIIFSLSEEQEIIIAEEFYTRQDFLDKYPDIPSGDIDEEIEVAEILLPAAYVDICEKVAKDISKDTSFSYRRINETTSHIYFCADEWPFREDLFDFFIRVRKIAEGMEVAA